MARYLVYTSPARGALGRLRDRLLGPVLLGLYNHLAPELDAVRAQIGAPPVRRIERAMVRAPIMLYMTAEPFEYPRSDWPGSVRLVGPGIWDPPAESPAWLDEVRRPVVLVTCSTEFQNDSKLVQTALEARGRRSRGDNRRRRSFILYATSQRPGRAFRSAPSRP